MQGRLMMILFAVICTTMIGSAVVAALTMGLDTARPLMLAIGGGFLLSIPVTWFVARQMTKLSR